MYDADVYSTNQNMYSRPPLVTDVKHGHQPTNAERPPYSFVALIIMAIRSYPEARATLKDIYHYIASSFPYYRKKSPGWKNSIRHNLSLNKCFIKIDRSINDQTHGHFWRLAKGWEDKFADNDLRRRCRWYKRVDKCSPQETNNRCIDTSVAPHTAVHTPATTGKSETTTKHRGLSFKFMESTPLNLLNEKQFSDFSIAKILRLPSKRKAEPCKENDTKRIRTDVFELHSASRNAMRMESSSTVNACRQMPSRVILYYPPVARQLQ